MKLGSVSTFNPLENIVIATKQKATDDIFVLPQLDGSNLLNIQGTISISTQEGNMISRKSDGIYAKIPDSITTAISNVLTENDVKNIILSYDYVDHDDYATSYNAGIVKIGEGLSIDGNANLSVLCGTGITIDDNGRLSATGTGDIDYGIMEGILGINTLVKSISIDGYVLTITRKNNTSYTLTIPSSTDTKIVSGEYSNGTLTLHNSDNTTVTVSGITANAQIDDISTIVSNQTGNAIAVIDNKLYVDSSDFIIDTNNFVSVSTFNEHLADYNVVKGKAHVHSNKNVLDNFATDAGGNLTYNGNALGSVSMYESEFTRSDSTDISWNGDIMTVTHGLASNRIVNVCIQNTVANEGTKTYDGLGIYIQDSNTIQVAVPINFNLSNGTWKIVVSAMA